MKLVRLIARLGSALTVGALLAACGGASRVSTFAPTSLVVFGDEHSLVTTSTTTGSSTNGVSYTINYWNATTSQVDCRLNPVWSQYIANSFGLVFAQCNMVGAAVPTAFMQAAYQARVADVVTQINSYTTATGFTPKTLVTVMAGLWDIQDAYNAVVAGTLNQAAATANVTAAATQLAAAINGIANGGNGGRVLVSKLFSLALTPCTDPMTSTSQPFASGGGITTCAQRNDLLNALTNAFNSQLDLQVTNNGYYVGIVRTEVVVAAVASIASNPNGYGITNNSTAACTVALPDCTSEVNTTTVTPTDLLADSVTINSSNVVSVYKYLWADATHLGPTAQGQIGVAADRIARNNPF